MVSGPESETSEHESYVPVLRSLGPTYEPKLHGRHVAVMLQVLTDKAKNPAKNIALSGHYGSGKSSVLLGVQEGLTARRVNWVNLSLSSLGVDDTKRGRVLEDGSVAPLTNLIQKEIVKQLLYRKAPADVPGSRYYRIDSFRVGPAALWASLMGVAFFVIAVLLGLVKRVQRMGPHDLVNSHDWVPWTFVALFGSLLGGAWFLGLRSLQNRVRVESVSAGGAAVQLSATDNSYFDEYLDEIVYFFQKTKTQVAIFEDLDRFKDPHIFETLRELNTVLNNSEQIRSRPVRFVYAVRDSIFEQLELHDAETAGGAKVGETALQASKLESAPSANRTKFFDLVIPMVPFITHRSARDLVAEEFVNDSDQPSTDLVNLVGVHLTDMRLIRNIRNEYEIYRPTILGEMGLKGLTPDRLFAMMVYKNLHLEDFEAIRHGASQIDAAHKAFRDMVRHQNAHQAEVSKRALDDAASVGPWDRHAKAAGERLGAALAVVHRAARRGGAGVLRIQGKDHTLDSLTSGTLWKELFESRVDCQLVAPSHGGGSTPITFDELVVLGGESASALETAVELDVERLKSVSRTALATKDEVNRATMAQLMARTDLTMPTEAGTKNLDQMVAELVTPIAHDLLAKGYIDENFTLYCSDYHAIAISISAMNFILHCVQPNIADHQFRFDEPTSIDAVENESGARFLDGESVFNIEVFDHYLDASPDKLERALNKLVVRVDSDPSFVDAYFMDGAQGDGFTAELAARWPNVLVHLVERTPLDSERTRDLVNVAIAHADRSVAYATSQAVQAFLSSTYSEMSAFVGAIHTQGAAVVALVTSRLGVEVDSLALLGEEQRKAFVAAGLYSITRPNLESAVGEDSGLALDALASSEPVYSKVLDRLDDYLDLLANNEVAVEDPDQFVAVLGDVGESDSSLVQEVAERAAPGCVVGDLEQVEESLWEPIVAARRVETSVLNVSRFVARFAVTDNMARVLSESTLVGVPDAAEDARLELAYALAEAENLSEDDTVRLIGELRLPSGIDPDRLGETGLTILPELLAAKLVPDTPVTYACIREADYRTREDYFATSRELASYVTELPLTSEDLATMMKSRRVSAAVKRAIAQDAEFVRARLTRSSAIAICAWADRGEELSVGLLEDLSAARAPADRILSLLTPHLDDIDGAALDRILTSLGDEYELLTRTGRHRPKVKDRPGTEELLKELKHRDRVSSFSQGFLGSYRVNMKH